MESLSHLLRARRESQSPVAIGPNRIYTWRHFQAHVAGLCDQLKMQPQGRWLLSSQSSYAFNVGLFALWQTGRIAVLPPNLQQESLSEVSEGIDGILTDSSTRSSRVPSMSLLSVTGTRRRWKELSLSRVSLELFTSGSTGERKAVTKTLAHLQGEITVLEKTFGGRLGSCQVYSTVPHQHIYGLLFRLLWPLCVGRPFADDTVLLWEELGPRLNKSPSACLVSSPAHLERISPAGKKSLKPAHPRMIFSSGGPLRESAVKFIRDKCGQAPVEVFGSTETGGVGWRQRNAVARVEDWTPLQGVALSCTDSNGSGRFRVRSPFVSSSEGTLLMGDRGIVFKDGTFRLKGRIDRIVKIAEKRLSLDDMERRLERHSWAAEAKIVLLEPHNGASRILPGAAIVLNTRGRSRLKGVGRAVLATEFRNHLRKSFDASTLPRSFRFIDTVPRNAQGKVSHAALRTLFQDRFDPSLTTPQSIHEAKGKTRLRLRMRVPEELAYLEGHFPQHPIVPGVVQLKWVVEAAAQWLDIPITVRRMEAIKFKNILMPGRTFSLVVDQDASGPKQILRFCLMDKKTLYSSGRLVLA